MSRNQAEELLRDWNTKGAKVFRFRQYVALPEILVIVKEDVDTFIVDKDKSTDKAGPFDFDDMVRFLITDVLEYLPLESTNVNHREARTGGCDCGAWRTSNPDMHSAIMPCRKYRR